MSPSSRLDLGDDKGLELQLEETRKALSVSFKREASTHLFLPVLKCLGYWIWCLKFNFKLLVRKYMRVHVRL